VPWFAQDPVRLNGGDALGVSLTTSPSLAAVGFRSSGSPHATTHRKCNAGRGRSRNGWRYLRGKI